MFKYICVTFGTKGNNTLTYTTYHAKWYRMPAYNFARRSPVLNQWDFSGGNI